MKRSKKEFIELVVIIFFVGMIAALTVLPRTANAGVLDEIIEIIEGAYYTGTPLIEDKPAPEEPSIIERKALDAYDFSCTDSQYPGYPTGCEGVSAAVMLRINGIDISNDEFMDALPKGGGEDFVHAFWGDPTTPAGFACMAPCIKETVSMFLPEDKTVLDLTGADLSELPTPCVIWVTMYFSDPQSTGYEQEGYHLFWNTHCVVLLSCGDEVQVWDPLQGGEFSVERSKLEGIYNTLGKQAVYIAPRGYTSEGRSF